MRKFKLVKLKENWGGYAKNWEEQLAQLETDGWKVLNIQQQSGELTLLIWMVKEGK